MKTPLTKGLKFILILALILVIVSFLLFAYSIEVTANKSDLEKRIELREAEVVELEQEIEGLKNDVIKLEREKEILLDENWSLNKELERIQGASE